MTTTYTTDADIRDQFVIPALGEFVADFDVDAITADVVKAAEWDDKGRLVVDADLDIYEIAQRHTR